MINFVDISIIIVRMNSTVVGILISIWNKNNQEGINGYRVFLSDQFSKTEINRKKNFEKFNSFDMLYLFLNLISSWMLLDI